MAPHALHPAGCIQFREQADNHALSLPTGGPNGKPCLKDLMDGARGQRRFWRMALPPTARCISWFYDLHTLKQAGELSLSLPPGVSAAAASGRISALRH